VGLDRAPYAIFKGLNTLKRARRNDLREKPKEYVEGGEIPIMRQTRWGLNAFTPLTDKWYRHLPMKDWADLLKETAPYFADHIEHADDGDYWYRANVNRHAASVAVPRRCRTSVPGPFMWWRAPTGLLGKRNHGALGIALIFQIPKPTQKYLKFL
jgi:hypothetical protein